MPIDSFEKSERANTLRLKLFLATITKILDISLVGIVTNKAGDTGTSNIWNTC